LRSGVFALEGARRTLEFTGVSRRPALSFLRRFSAPVRVDDDLSEDDLVTLLKHDRDSFNRWQALQTLATRLLLRCVAAIRSGSPRTPEAAFIDACGSVIADALSGRIDPAFAAQALALPSEADIAREMAVNVDPDAIYRARENLRGALGRAHAVDLIALYDAMADDAPFNPDAAGAGRRALRNGALAMFVAGAAVEGGARAHRQFAEADNMTARLGALAAIAMIPGVRRERAFDSFARRFAAEPLILDKWFALQAQIPERRTVERVRGLMTHHAFSLSNPNRVRALLGGFTANATQFNRADGAGYDLICEVVLTLDPTNPQVAARLLTAMRSWRSLEAGRQAKAEAVLRRIIAQPNLSTDVRDIVTRSLA
jgi:aminopeptidase N